MVLECMHKAFQNFPELILLFNLNYLVNLITMFKTTLLAESGEHLFTERSWVQIPARYSGWSGHYNNVCCSARMKTNFELNPVTKGKQGTLPYITLMVLFLHYIC